MSLLIFIFILGIMILVHEWGHFITAKKCGVKVEQFAIGFGPKLLSWVHDGTEFCLCAVWIGGFVKMAGDERDKCSGQKDEYFSKPAGQRALIILMGPVVNIIVAFFCFWVVFMIGYVDVNLSSQKVATVIGQVMENSPAAQAGLKTNDKILSIDGTPISHWDQLQEVISKSIKPVLSMSVERGNQDLTLSVNPKESDTRDVWGHQHKARIIGVAPMPLSAKDMLITHYDPFTAFGKAGEELWTITTRTYGALYGIAIGAVSPKDAVGGPITMFFVIKYAMTIGFSCVLYFVGFISASLGIINLLPVIPLDGGHLFLIGLEKLRGRGLSMKTDQLIIKTGFALILCLIVFVMYTDFDRYGWIDKIREVIHV